MTAGEGISQRSLRQTPVFPLTRTSLDVAQDGDFEVLQGVDGCLEL